MDVKTIVCPNCGANTTNTQNCEYCNSLLVRFIDKNIDLSKTSYLNKTEVFPGLIKALEENLALQEQEDERVATDIYNNKDDADILIAVLRTGYCAWQDGQKILLSKSNKGLVIVLCFSKQLNFIEKEDVLSNKKSDEQLRLFKQLPSFELFTPHNSIDRTLVIEYMHREYAIDFGEDAEGAACLISEILTKVYGVSVDENLLLLANYGEKIYESRKKMSMGSKDFRTGLLYWIFVIFVLIFLIFI